MKTTTVITAVLLFATALSCSQSDVLATSVSPVEEEPTAGRELVGPAAQYSAFVEAEGRIPEDEKAFRVQFDANLANDTDFDVAGTRLVEVACSASGCFMIVAHESGEAQRNFLLSPYSGGTAPLGPEGMVDPGEGDYETPTTFIMTSRLGGSLPVLDDD